MEGRVRFLRLSLASMLLLFELRVRVLGFVCDHVRPGL